MGGKTKQSQRTKNNVRPSSSGLAAVLVGATGGLAALAMEPPLSPEFALVFKKLHKKDPITKTKALQELTELSRSSRAEDVAAALRSWQQAYCALSEHDDRRVRECTQSCHAVVVSSCGRRVAPHLRALLPAWLTAAHDVHAPAAAHAHCALTRTFPEHKLGEALSFCKSEVLAHVVEGASSSEGSRAAPALHVLAMVCAQLPERDGAWLDEHMRAMLRRPAVWRLAQHTEARVRAAWYHAMEQVPLDALSEHGERALRVLLASRETEPATAAALWSCWLRLTRDLPNWHELVEDKQLPARRMIEMLQNGGWGDARQLHALLPPLLERVPAALLPPAFYDEFLDALLVGLQCRGVVSSPGESRWWAASVADGVVVAARAQPGGPAPSALRRWLELVLRVDAESQRGAALGAHLLRYSSTSLARLVLRCGREPELHSLERAFWQSLSSSAEAQLSTLANDPVIEQASERHVQLLLALLGVTDDTPRVTRNVQFSSDEDHEPREVVGDDRCGRGERDETPLGQQLTQQYLHNLHAVVSRASSLYLQMWEGGGRAAGAAGRALRALVGAVGAVPVVSGGGGALETAWRVVRGLRGGKETGARLLFDVLELVPADEQEAVLRAVPSESLECCVSSSLEGTRAACEALRAWRASEPVAKALGVLGERVTEHDDVHAASTLQRWLAPPKAFPPAGLAVLLAHVEPRVHASRSAARLAAQLAVSLHPAPPSLVLALLQHDVTCACAGEEVESVVRAAWSGRMRGLSAEERARAVRMLRDAAGTCPGAAHAAVVRRLAALSPHVITGGEGGEVLAGLLAGAPDDAALVTALRHLVVRGELSCPLPVDGDVAGAVTDDALELMADEAEHTVRAALFAAECARALLPHVPGEQLYERCAELWRDYSVIDALADAYAFSPLAEVLGEGSRVLRSTLLDTINACTEDTVRELHARLLRRSVRGGQHWSRASRLYREAAHLPPPEHGELAALAGDVTGNGYFHTLQMECVAGEAGAVRAAWEVLVRCARCVDPPCALPREPDADALVDAHYRHARLMLYDTELCSEPWPAVSASAAACEYLARLVEAEGWRASAHLWDFINISVTSLLASLERSREHWHTVKVGVMVHATLGLLRAVEGFVRAVPGRSERAQPAEHVARLPREWADVFDAPARRHLMRVVMHVLACGARCEGMTSVQAGVLRALCGAELRVPQEELRAAVAGAADALAAPAHHAYKYLAHHLLTTLHDPLVLHDAASLEAWSEAADESSECRPPPHFTLEWFRGPLRALQELVSAALHDVPEDGSCEVSPHTAAHSLALGYLLLSHALLAPASAHRSDLRQHYLEQFREDDLTEPLLTSVLRLVPADVTAAAVRGEPAGLDPDPFATLEPLDVSRGATSAQVGRVACRVLALAVCGPGGAAVRGWWGSAGARGRGLEALVRAHVSPALVRAQLSGAARATEVELRVARGGECCAALRVEGRTMELRVQFPPEHPLRPAHVSSTSPLLGVQWVSAYLAHRGGSLASALRMWSSAVRARVSRSPQCYICYCRLQPATGRLPDAHCKTCRNTFHSPCLRQWFKTSNKSTCPLCRAEF